MSDKGHYCMFVVKDKTTTYIILYVSILIRFILAIKTLTRGGIKYLSYFMDFFVKASNKILIYHG